jgi:predicted RNA methylase
MDIGCGKGRAVFVAEKLGFSRLRGIELDESLVAVANENKSKYIKRPQSSIEFIHANALSFSYPNEPTVYFLFNPFNE